MYVEFKFVRSVYFFFRGGWMSVFSRVSGEECLTGVRSGLSINVLPPQNCPTEINTLLREREPERKVKGAVVKLKT